MNDLPQPPKMALTGILAGLGLLHAGYARLAQRIADSLLALPSSSRPEVLGFLELHGRLENTAEFIDGLRIISQAGKKVIVPSLTRSCAEHLLNLAVFAVHDRHNSEDRIERLTDRTGRRVADLQRNQLRLQYGRLEEEKRSFGDRVEMLEKSDPDLAAAFLQVQRFLVQDGNAVIHGSLEATFSAAVGRLLPQRLDDTIGASAMWITLVAQQTLRPLGREFPRFVPEIEATWQATGQSLSTIATALELPIPPLEKLTDPRTLHKRQPS
ncbi:MAG: hypothetical protein ACYC2H_00985 [Thermoplasmatota archaeon]